MPRPSRRRQLIEVAADLFHRRGYEATAVAEILEGAGVGAGSFYYHFDSKEDLLLAVLDRYRELFPQAIEGPAREQTADPVERIFALLGVYRRFLLEHDFAVGCPVGNLALEVGDRLPAARERTAALFDQWRGAVLEALEEAGERLPEDLDRPGLAALVLTVMEGGVMQARAERSIAPFDASVAQLEDYVARLLAEGAGGGWVGLGGGAKAPRHEGRPAEEEREDERPAKARTRPTKGEKGGARWRQESWKVW